MFNLDPCEKQAWKLTNTHNLFCILQRSYLELNISEHYIPIPSVEYLQPTRKMLINYIEVSTI